MTTSSLPITQTVTAEELALLSHGPTRQLQSAIYTLQSWPSRSDPTPVPLAPVGKVSNTLDFSILIVLLGGKASRTYTSRFVQVAQLFSCK